MRKWQKDITVTAGTPTFVEIPAGVGAIMCSLDFAGTGSGSASYSNYTYDDSAQLAPADQWQATSIATSTADASVVINSQATGIMLEAVTTDQRFILVGEQNV